MNCFVATDEIYLLFRYKFQCLNLQFRITKIQLKLNYPLYLFIMFKLAQIVMFVLA